METVVVMSAHTDDFVLGAGGTIKNYTDEGKKVISIIFSLGEKSHAWLKDDVIKDTRKKETKTANKFLKTELLHLDLKDQSVYKEYQEKNKEKQLLKLLNKEKPTKIFTHSSEDPHPDHRTVHKITQELLKKLPIKPEVYIYSVWNPVEFKTDFPALYVDITKSFSTKIKAIKKFKSQQMHIVYPVFMMFFRAIKHGLKVKGRFAEMFYRIQ